MKSGVAARRSIPWLIAAWLTNRSVRDRGCADPIARARQLALGGGDRNPAQDHGDRQSEQDADDGKRKSADKEPQNNPSYKIPGYCWGCAEVAGGLVSRMTGKSSGSFAAQAATRSVEAKQSTAVVPASAARMLPDWWSMSRLHIFLRRSFGRSCASTSFVGEHRPRVANKGTTRLGGGRRNSRTQ